MIILLTSTWAQSLELTLLKYELVTLQQGLVVLLKECNSRIKELNKSGPDLEKNLKNYLLQLLYNQLLMLLLELTDRYLHLLEERGVTLEELYVSGRIRKNLFGYIFV